ncbi:MAG: ATP-dependent RNA helicase [Tenericutes bacterium HGW-Tenericutes-5]|jgi:ATP-dependent RNA helicase DeaD|nr:MAG: ATP-dependent RNA helicase [Tenericutes bacterium HGW-Tenericutes-5]
MKIKNEIQQAITEMGFVNLTPIQEKTIPLLLMGKDVIGNSHTGTGKTAAFGIPLLEMIDFTSNEIQALIMTPTRELSVQIKQELTNISKYIDNCRIVNVYGGEIITKQFAQLKKKPQIIIGTPGRIIDHLRRKTLDFSKIKYLVLDEADEMLKMGFVEDIETIFEYTPATRQTLMFSATMPKRIVDLARKYLVSPEVVSSVGEDLTNQDISQYYYKVKKENKTEAIYRLLNIYRPTLALIFCNTKAQVDKVTEELIDRKINCDKIHGDLPQTTRLDVLNKFHNGVIEVLVATDVAARGLDIKKVEAVFNYDVPEKAEYYIHRIGRTGRIGNIGYSFTLVSKGEVRKIAEIERLSNSKIKKRNIPTYDKVLDVKSSKFVEEIKEIINNESLEKEYLILNQLISDNLKEDEIIAALIKKLNALEVNHNTTDDINETFNTQDTSRSKDSQVRFHINIGKEDNLTVSDVLDFVTSNVKITAKEIQDIAIMSTFSFFSVDKSYGPVILNNCKSKKLKGKRIFISVSRKSRR